MNVPFCDLSKQHEEIKRELSLAIEKVINRGDFILGQDLVEFEKEFAAFCNCPYALGVSSGTAALFLALKGLDIGQLDEVIVPAFTFIASALAVSYTGAKPVFVDIDEATYNIDVNKIEKAITRKTKAIMVVHLYGQPANMPKIMQLANKHNLKVIEDAAQAHGASITMPEGRRMFAGEIGDVGCFSFYPSKNLGAMGDGGMVVTKNKAVFDKLCMLRDYGRISKYEHAMIGYNSRLDTIQAALLRIKLKRIDKWNNLRQEAAKIYDSQLNSAKNVVCPVSLPSVKHIYHVYAIRSAKRDQIHRALSDAGVSSIIHYPIPLHLQKAYAHLKYKKGDFAVAEKVCDEILSLPMFPYITEEQIKFVTGIIKDIV
ncbi:MAG: DegT/DnrJ/EryC1/StrS family aminotransferase [Candidatus Omnitrophota bacterium]|nr:MAG: DegT/DnrJ/EryC1/StrS family aminotransferase [Candidatus Omnitrophota bacterium]